MKLLGAVCRPLAVSLALLASTVDAQWVDRVLYLPDSIIGADRPAAVAAARTGTKAYVGGIGGLPAVVAVDCATGRKVARVPWTEDVEQLLADPVLVCFVGRTRAAALSPLGDTLVAELAYGDGPGLAAAAGGRLYIANSLYGSLLKVRMPYLTVEDTIPVPLTPVAMAHDVDHQKLYVAGSQGVVASIDLAGDSVKAMIPAGASPSTIAAARGFNRVFCGNRLGASVTVINAYLDSVIATVPVGTGPVALAVNPPQRAVYAACRNAGRVDVIDIDSLIVRAEIPVAAPRSLAVSSDGSRLYVGTAGDRLAVVDATSNTVIAELPSGGDVLQVAFSDSAGLAVVPGGDAGTVTLVRDTAVSAVLQVASSFPRAGLVAGGKLYIAEERMDRVRVLARPGLGTVATVPVGERPFDLCWSRTSGKVYVACRDAGQLAVIDGVADTLLRMVDAGSSPYSLVWDSVGDKLYCGNYGAPELTVVDCATDSVVARARTGRATRKVALSRASRKVYVACHDERAIYAIDCATDSVIAAFGTPGNPWTLAIDQEHNVIYAPTSWGMPIICGYGDTLIADNPDVFYCKGACWNPVSGDVYAALNFSDRVMRFEGATGTVLPSVGTTESPADMVSLADTTLVHCAHNYNLEVIDRVSVIDHDSLVATLIVPPTPVALVADEPLKRVYALSGYSSTVSVIAHGPQAVAGRLPGRRSGLRAVPNPFRDAVSLSLATGETGPVEVFDATGRRVARLQAVNGSATWNCVRAASGVYFARVGRDVLRLLKAR